MQNIWNYDNAIHKAIYNPVDSFNWKKVFSNVNVET